MGLESRAIRQMQALISISFVRKGRKEGCRENFIVLEAHPLCPSRSRLRSIRMRFRLVHYERGSLENRELLDGRGVGLRHPSDYS
ncbi:hypothetical protein CDAR_64991 [Caerostris darwini]|uniref:Uncharacterized protein n=1 Tax=Caerostris darwini TaxID=1538125 RepID=A0AAV4W081_9ARAC|nr:hypothetical protein CDAR_64991 [Caerostris darwini]